VVIVVPPGNEGGNEHERFPSAATAKMGRQTGRLPNTLITRRGQNYRAGLAGAFRFIFLASISPSFSPGHDRKIGDRKMGGEQRGTRFSSSADGGWRSLSQINAGRAVGGNDGARSP
jgi:hypothetical protein